MGAFFAKLFGFFKKHQSRVVIIGLDGAGKTTMLYKMKLGVVVQALPTLGFNYEVVKVGQSELAMWDLGGQTHIRTYWRLYYQNTNGVVFVVDAADHDKLAIARTELHGVLQEAELKGVPLLVFANKMDLENALPVTELSQQLQLHLIRDRPWSIQPCSVVEGSGVEEGWQWLISQLK
ncbi:Arl1 [Monocercomonoides exilis]|uniref:Arl1 n=1 Tax=Monocercomonoides exilis TaxID=2049356 RepID=UPI0035594995|nr:Arl1 [Monocercomonoides exilis]|eukprot:MONOS_16774.1-p1 / transcript=MONOS_16774.1 / gene=MONOS_16774 / organism=Monocercomonoides_exilis_PA203 / gene_product=Arl1 / transcript_product=Arl1 / location=Mono_scaffold00181:1712-2581(-) / protein_length=178 / sequence_SO=supercontig / SO=protein_coding / is_pseudo=false